MKYSIWYGTKAEPFTLGFGAPYAQGASGEVIASTVDEALEEIFQTLNSGKTVSLRCLTVGDVVLVDSQAFRFQPSGFAAWDGFQDFLQEHN